MIYRAEVRLRHPTPEQADNDQPGRPGEKQQPTRQRATAKSPVEVNGKEEGQNGSYEHYAGGPDDCADERAPGKPADSEQSDVVADPAESLEPAELIDAVERHRDCVDDRIEHEHCGKQRRRR